MFNFVPKEISLLLCYCSNYTNLQEVPGCVNCGAMWVNNDGTEQMKGSRRKHTSCAIHLSSNSFSQKITKNT